MRRDNDIHAQNWRFWTIVVRVLLGLIVADQSLRYVQYCGIGSHAMNTNLIAAKQAASPEEP